MPDVRLTIDDQAWTNWTRTEIETDFLTPSDGWSVEAVNPSKAQLGALALGAPVTLLVDGAVALTGALEEKASRRSADGLTISLSGRDHTAALVDCAPSSWSFQKLSLERAAKTMIANLDLPLTVEADADAKAPLDLVRLEPGETYWAALERYTKRAGLMLWTSRDGVLHIGRPDSTSAPVATLRHHARGARGQSNVLSLSHQERRAGRHSEIVVLAQAKGSDSFYGDGPAKLREYAEDVEITDYRPLTIDEGELSGTKAAHARAAWEVGRRKYDATRLDIGVAGVGPRLGELWTPNTRVTLEDDVLGLSGVWWVAAAKTSITTEQGAVTQLELRIPGLLAPEIT